MAHEISRRPGYLEIRYLGRVGYRDRLDGLAAMSDAYSRALPAAPVLINFLDTNIAADVENEHRADYMATMITHPFFVGRRIAMVGITSAQAEPATLAATVAKLEFARFEDRDAAVAWLTGTVANVP
ncbi:hypothetical protein [Lysobacter sp. HA35]